MSHRRQKKLENKKNKNAKDHEQILRNFLRELNQEIDQLKKRIKIVEKLRDAIQWTLI